jgi:hypothetical protein
MAGCRLSCVVETREAIGEACVCDGRPPLPETAVLSPPRFLRIRHRLLVRTGELEMHSFIALFVGNPVLSRRVVDSVQVPRKPVIGRNQ